MEEKNQFVSDGVFLIQRVLFKREKEMRGVYYSSIEKISGVGGKEEGKDMLVAKRRGGSGLGGRGEGGGKESHQLWYGQSVSLQKHEC